MTSQNYMNPREVKMHQIKQSRKDVKEKITLYLNKLKILDDKN